MLFKSFSKQAAIRKLLVFSPALHTPLFTQVFSTMAFSSVFQHEPTNLTINRSPSRSLQHLRDRDTIELKYSSWFDGLSVENADMVICDNKTIHAPAACDCAEYANISQRLGQSVETTGNPLRSGLSHIIRPVYRKHDSDVAVNVCTIPNLYDGWSSETTADQRPCDSTPTAVCFNERCEYNYKYQMSAENPCLLEAEPLRSFSSNERQYRTMNIADFGIRLQRSGVSLGSVEGTPTVTCMSMAGSHWSQEGTIELKQDRSQPTENPRLEHTSNSTHTPSTTTLCNTMLSERTSVTRELPSSNITPLSLKPRSTEKHQSDRRRGPWNSECTTLYVSSQRVEQRASSQQQYNDWQVSQHSLILNKPLQSNLYSSSRAAGLFSETNTNNQDNSSTSAIEFAKEAAQDIATQHRGTYPARPGCRFPHWVLEPRASKRTKQWERGSSPSKHLAHGELRSIPAEGVYLEIAHERRYNQSTLSQDLGSERCLNWQSNSSSDQIRPDIEPALFLQSVGTKGCITADLISTTHNICISSPSTCPYTALRAAPENVKSFDCLCIDDNEIPHVNDTLSQDTPIRHTLLQPPAIRSHTNLAVNYSLFPCSDVELITRPQPRPFSSMLRIRSGSKVRNKDKPSPLCCKICGTETHRPPSATTFTGVRVGRRRIWNVKKSWPLIKGECLHCHRAKIAQKVFGKVRFVSGNPRLKGRAHEVKYRHRISAREVGDKLGTWMPRNCFCQVVDDFD